MRGLQSALNVNVFRVWTGFEDGTLGITWGSCLRMLSGESASSDSTICSLTVQQAVKETFCGKLYIEIWFVSKCRFILVQLITESFMFFLACAEYTYCCLLQYYSERGSQVCEWRKSTYACLSRHVYVWAKLCTSFMKHYCYWSCLFLHHRIMHDTVGKSQDLFSFDCICLFLSLQLKLHFHPVL